MSLRKDRYSESLSSGADVWFVLRSILHHPLRMIALWNVKTAVLSAAFRGIIFLVAVSRSHHFGRSEAVFIEVFYGAVTGGVFGTLAQSLRSAQPAWIAESLLFLVVPVLFQGLELAAHTVFGTTYFRSGLFASAAVTGLSALFNLFAMRRGALLMGGESNPFSKDLCDLPRLALQFLLAIPVNVARFFAELRSSFLPGGKA